MKKLGLVLVLLLSFGLIGVSADATLGGYIWTDVTIDDTGVNYAPLVINSLSVSGDDCGLAANVWTFSDTLATDFRDWNVWYKMLDGMLKVSAGKLRDGSYRLTNFTWDASGLMDRITGDGVLVQLMPMDGLSIGVDIPAEGAALADTFSDLDIYAKYEMADLFGAYVGALLGTTFGLYVGVDVLAVENLDARVVYSMDTGYDDLQLSVGYGLDALYVAASFNMAFAASTWGLHAYLSYALDALTPQVAFDYDSTGAYSVLAFVALPFSSGTIYPGFGFADGAWSVPISFEFWY